MGELRIMEVDAGDLKVIWNKDEPEEIAAAKEQFKRLVKKGYLAYTVDKKGEAGKQITEFDEKAEKIILSPAVQGG